MSVTIWDPAANEGAGGIARVGTPVYTPAEDPEQSGTTEIVYGPPLARMTDPGWVRPRWHGTPAQADPHGAGASNFEAGWVILVDVDVTPSLGDDEVLGALGEAPTVDLEELSATWTYAVASKSLSVRKAAMTAAIKAKALGPGGVVSEGFVYSVPGSPEDPHTYQIELNDQGNMTSIGGLFALGVADAHGGFWRDAANVNVTMSQAECTAFFEAATAYKSAVVRRMWVLIAAVVQAADHAALDLINVSAGTINGADGWPANG